MKQIRSAPFFGLAALLLVAACQTNSQPVLAVLDKCDGPPNADTVDVCPDHDTKELRQVRQDIKRNRPRRKK